MTSSFLPPTLFPMSTLLPPLGLQVPLPRLQMQHQELAQLLPPLTAFFPTVFTPQQTPVQQEPPPIQQNQPPVLEFYGKSQFNDDLNFKKSQNPVQQTQPPLLQFYGNSQFSDDSKFKKPLAPIQQGQPPVRQLYGNNQFNDNSKFKKPRTPEQQNQPPVFPFFENCQFSDDSTIKKPQTPVQQYNSPVLEFFGTNEFNDDSKFKKPRTTDQQVQPPVLQFFENSHSNDDSTFKKPQNPSQQSHPPVLPFYGNSHFNDDAKFKRPRTPPPKQRCQLKPHNPQQQRFLPIQQPPKRKPKRTYDEPPQSTPMLPPFFEHYFPMRLAKSYLDHYAKYSTQPAPDDSPDIIILEGPTTKKPRINVVPDVPLETTKIEQEPIYDQNPPQLTPVSPNPTKIHKTPTPKPVEFSEKNPEWAAKLVEAIDRMAAANRTPPPEEDPSIPPNTARYMTTLIPNYIEWKYQLCMHRIITPDDLDTLLTDQNNCILRRRLSGHYHHILTDAELRKIDAEFRQIANLIMLISSERQKKLFAKELLSNLRLRTSQLLKLRQQTGYENFTEMVSDLIYVNESQTNFNVRLPTPEEINKAIEDAFNKLEYEDLDSFKKMMFIFSMQYDWKNPEENTGHIEKVSELTQLTPARVIEIMNAARVEIRAIIAQQQYYWSIDDELPHFD
ncbi:hypothetical protein CRE_21958 [Caenorhabditis remanei]|uniref:Uncharacterized protein n=1 Tax=Caenorhabditis remanei TaxID=31234 RepID=E3MUJ1_CAERE|nr:hypothetical protein CRE_21958 [Caenorhabditis remanei]